MKPSNPAPGSDAVVRMRDLIEARSRTESIRDALKVHEEIAEREPVLAHGIQLAVKEALHRYEENCGPLLPIERISLRQEQIMLSARVYVMVTRGFRELLDGGTAASMSSGS